VNRARLRSCILTVAFVALLAAGWWYFAPTKIGGTTRYVVTKGISMEPLFHSGDLAIVRPAAQYKVGDIVAYWSTLLHTVALHRIIAIHDGRYTFKGDNNHFTDPTHPTRSLLLGKLWIHVPHGGVWLNLFHTPVVAAVVCALLGLFLVFGLREQRVRRRRRRKGAQGSLLQGTALVKTSPDDGLRPSINLTALLTASAVAAAVFLVLAVIAFAQPATRASETVTPYTQQVTFGYSAQAPAGPVYPTGKIDTGDPIFLSLVHQVDVRIKYGFSTLAQHDIQGSEEILAQLSGQSGWTRNLVVVPRTHFTGDQTSTDVVLGLHKLQSLLAKVGALTGVPGVTYTVAIEPVIHITGTVAGNPVNATFSPAMNFELGPQQLVPQGAATTPSQPGAATAPPPGAASTDSLAPSISGKVGTSATEPAAVNAFGISLGISLLRWLAVVGLLGSIAATVFFYLRKRAEPFQETAHIQSQYGHLIVPIVAGEDLGWPAVDVATIKALAKLAESGQRLILHSRSGDVDTYMVNDEGTVYRYQVRPSKVVWGEWSDTAAPVRAAA
jgi:signal peptidase I